MVHWKRDLNAKTQKRDYIQGDQISLWKMAQNVAQPMFYRGKSSLKIWATSAIFKRLPKVNNRPTIWPPWIIYVSSRFWRFPFPHSFLCSPPPPAARTPPPTRHWQRELPCTSAFATTKTVFFPGSSSSKVMHKLLFWDQLLLLCGKDDRGSLRKQEHRRPPRNLGFLDLLRSF
jgi:hypothetical protein